MKNIYFYVETAVGLTDKNDTNWMRLFIDIDRDKSTGWDASGFASGIYFYRIITDTGFMGTKKLLLLK